MAHLHSDHAPDSGPTEDGVYLSLEWLSSLGEEIRTSVDRRALARMFAERAGLATGAQASLFIWASAAWQSPERTSSAAAAQIRGTSSAALDEQLTVWAAALAPDSKGMIRRADLSDRGTSDPSASHLSGRQSDAVQHGAIALQSVLSVPVSARSGALLGRICLGHAGRSAFTEDHERIATGLATWAAISLENLTLRDIDTGRSSDQSLNLALGSAGIGVWEWDLDSGIISWTGSTPELDSGASRSRGTIEDFESTIHPADAAAVHDAITRTIRDGDGRVEFRTGHSGHERKWMEWSGALVRGDDGAPRRVLGVLRDVTESRRKRERVERQARKLTRFRVALEQVTAELHDAYQDLNDRAVEYERMSIAEKEANRAKSDFMATMSHELRTPLNAISGYVELLELEIRGPLTDAQREDLARIKNSQQTLLSLINDILNFSRLEAGCVPFALVPVRLSKIIADLDPLVRPRAHAKKIAFQIDAPSSPVTALADPERLTQLLLNLLSNAVKYTDSGGMIVISSSGTPTHALVTIRDTGCGISESQLLHVFDPFVKVESIPSNRQQGVGLGLAISQGIARAMNGNITARSEVGRGSEFTVSLLRADLQGAH